jgi:hypothetical protein
VLLSANSCPLLSHIIRISALSLLSLNPDLGFSQLHASLNAILGQLFPEPGEFQATISRSTLTRLLQELDYTWTMAIRFERAKYAWANIERYVHYCFAVQDLPFHALKFVDEIHFLSKGSSSLPLALTK